MNKFLTPIQDLISYTKMFQYYLGTKMYIIFIFSTIASVLEGFGILMLLPLLESIEKNNKISSSSDFFYRFISNMLDFIGLSNSTVSVLFLILIVFTLKGLITLFTLSINAYLIGELLKKLKIDLFENYTNMSFSYYSSKNTGDFINLIAEQPNKAIESFNQLNLLGSHLINTIVLITLAFIMSYSFGLLAFLAGFFLLLVFLKMNAYVQSLSRVNANENANLNKWLVQILHAFKYLVSTNQIKKLKRNIFSSINILTSTRVKAGVAGAFTQSIREPLAVILVVTIIYFQLIIFDQRLEPILVSIVLFYRSLNSTLAVQSAFQFTFQMIGSIELINEEYKKQKINSVKKGEMKIELFSKGIEFKNVSFNYDNCSTCLNNLNLKIKAKSTLGIVGESGSGKTTLINLITLLNNISKGKLLIDGIPSTQINKESWRAQIGYISQETVIFDDTIANNISMWDDNYERIENRLIKVAEQANILDFINSLPKGFNTKVGDRGVQLSGGQKQRIFIARELYRKPALLILDEATSSLDTKAEKKIQKSIENIQGDLTLIIVAHRISTIRNVDKIIILEEGIIKDFGNYKDLKSKSKLFNSFISLQKT